MNRGLRFSSLFSVFISVCGERLFLSGWINVMLLYLRYDGISSLQIWIITQQGGHTKEEEGGLLEQVIKAFMEHNRTVTMFFAFSYIFLRKVIDNICHICPGQKKWSSLVKCFTLNCVAMKKKHKNKQANKQTNKQKHSWGVFWPKGHRILSLEKVSGAVPTPCIHLRPDLFSLTPLTPNWANSTLTY